MKNAIRKGLGFGLTSGVITTLGLIIGLHSGTHSKMVILGGILTIAIADAFSDALGVHISEEFKGGKPHKEIWASTFFTFIFKLIFASTFIVPVMLLDLETAIWVSLAWGLGVITLISLKMAQENKEHYLEVVGEHLGIAILVVVITHYVGDFVANHFESI